MAVCCFWQLRSAQCYSTCYSAMEGGWAEGAVSSAALRPPQSYICKLHPRNWHVVCTQRPRICLFPLLLDQACWLLSEFFICISPWLFLDWVSFRPVQYERGLVSSSSIQHHFLSNAIDFFTEVLILFLNFEACPNTIYIQYIYHERDYYLVFPQK